MSNNVNETQVGNVEEFYATVTTPRLANGNQYTITTQSNGVWCGILPTTHPKTDSTSIALTYQLVNTKGDGNCFFQAVLIALCKECTIASINSLRKDLCDIMATTYASFSNVAKDELNMQIAAMYQTGKTTWRVLTLSEKNAIPARSSQHTRKTVEVNTPDYTQSGIAVNDVPSYIKYMSYCGTCATHETSSSEDTYCTMRLNETSHGTEYDFPTSGAYADDFLMISLAIYCEQQILVMSITDAKETCAMMHISTTNCSLDTPIYLRLQGLHYQPLFAMKQTKQRATTITNVKFNVIAFYILTQHIITFTCSLFTIQESWTTLRR